MSDVSPFPRLRGKDGMGGDAGGTPALQCIGWW